MEGRVIRFSHRGYCKLNGVDVCAPVKLLEVFQKHYTDLSDIYKGYDTSYLIDGVRDGVKSMGFYQLPNALLLVLLFEDKHGKVFTTMRRYAPDKWDYYRRMRGEEFKIIFDEVKK